MAITALASVVHLVGGCPLGQKVTGSIPSQGTYPGCRFDPLSGCVQEDNQTMFLSLPPSPFLSLSKKPIKGNDHYTTDLSKTFIYIMTIWNQTAKYPILGSAPDHRRVWVLPGQCGDQAPHLAHSPPQSPLPTAFFF